MSAAAPTTRGRVAALVGGEAQGLEPASMAGLPGSRAMVGVGPPLSWSGPELGIDAHEVAGRAASVIPLRPGSVLEQGVRRVREGGLDVIRLAANWIRDASC